jgi:hypothetical protein
MSTVTLRRSPRLAAKEAARQAAAKPFVRGVQCRVHTVNGSYVHHNTISSATNLTSQNSNPAVLTLKSMISAYEQMSKTADQTSKIIHLARMYEFMLDDKLTKVLKTHKTFFDVVRAKIIEHDTVIQQINLPYWVSLKFYNACKNLNKHLDEIEQSEKESK